MKPFNASFIPVWVLLMLALGCANHGKRGGGSGHYISKIHPSQSSDTVAVSMRTLIQQAQSGRLGKDGASLGGMGWLEGYVIDPESRDIILVGKRVAGWPSLHLDDLAVSLRNQWHHLEEPYCSLDPRPQDVARINQIAAQDGADYISRLKGIWGPQTVRVGGVPRDSHDAHVMIDADYHMKKLSQGLESMDGVSSCMDLALQDATLAVQSGKTPSAAASMSRFWFHFGRNEPNFKESDGIVMIDRCSVAVLTEKQRAASDGTLADSGGDDPYARQFAQQLTERYQHAAMKVREYAELENIFRLSAVVGAMKFAGADAKSGLDMGGLLSGYSYTSATPMPASLPGLANSKESRVKQYILMPVVCGGVSREIQLGSAKFSRSESPRLQRFRSVVLSSRPAADSLSWRVDSSL